MDKDTKEISLIAAKVFVGVTAFGLALIAFEWINKFASPKSEAPIDKKTNKEAS